MKWTSLDKCTFFFLPAYSLILSLYTHTHAPCFTQVSMETSGNGTEDSRTGMFANETSSDHMSTGPLLSACLILQHTLLLRHEPSISLWRHFEGCECKLDAIWVSPRWEFGTCADHDTFCMFPLREHVHHVCNRDEHKHTWICCAMERADRSDFTRATKHERTSVNNTSIADSVLNTWHFRGKACISRCIKEMCWVFHFINLKVCVFITLWVNNENTISHSEHLATVLFSSHGEQGGSHLRAGLSTVPRRRVGVRLW